MRRRTGRGEAFQMDRDRWVLLNDKGERPVSIMSEALQAGYVWDVDHPRSVGSKQIVVPEKDGWFEHLMNCAEYLEANFGGAQPSEAQVERRVAAQEREQVRRAQIDRDEKFQWHPKRAPRGGY